MTTEVLFVSFLQVRYFFFFFFGVYSCLAGWLFKIQGKDKTAEERRIAICIFDDVAEQCREAALK